MQIKTLNNHIVSKTMTIDIEDIAHALSNQCIFQGHSKTFISYAEFSSHLAARTEMSNHKLYSLFFNSWRCFEFIYQNQQDLLYMQDYILRKIGLSSQFQTILTTSLNKYNKNLTELLFKRFILDEELEEQEQKIEYGLPPLQAKEIFLNIYEKYK